MIIRGVYVILIISMLVCGAFVWTATTEKTEIPALETNYFLRKQTKYLGGGKLEHVTFKTQELEHDTAKHIERNGILFLNPEAQATVVVCHGFMCDKFDVSFVRKTLFSKYNVMVFDFRAHGENVSQEQCCTFGKHEAFDVQGAVCYLKSRSDIGHLPRIAYAFSMGAVAAILAQANDSSLFDALILDCPYDKSVNVIKKSIEKLKITLFGYTFDVPGKALLERFAFNPYVQSMLKSLLKTIAQLDATAINTFIYPTDPIDYVRNIKVPCLFIHCINDEKVPPKASKDLFDNVKGYKRIWFTHGRRHFDSIFYNPEKYIYKVNTFVEDVLSGKYKTKMVAKIYRDAQVAIE